MAAPTDAEMSAVARRQAAQLVRRELGDIAIADANIAQDNDSLVVGAMQRAGFGGDGGNAQAAIAAALAPGGAFTAAIETAVAHAIAGAVAPGGVLQVAIATGVANGIAAAAAPGGVNHAAIANQLAAAVAPGGLFQVLLDNVFAKSQNRLQEAASANYFPMRTAINAIPANFPADKAALDDLSSDELRDLLQDFGVNPVPAGKPARKAALRAFMGLPL